MTAIRPGDVRREYRSTFPMPYFVRGAGGVETLVDRTSGTAIGDLTSGGGLAAAFSGAADELAVNSCRSAADVTGATFVYVGKDYSAVGAKRFSKMVVKAPTDSSFFEHSDAGEIRAYGKNGAPSPPTDGTQIGTSGALSGLANGVERTVTSTNTSTAHAHIWAALDPSGTNGKVYVGEMEIYELIG